MWLLLMLCVFPTMDVRKLCLDQKYEQALVFKIKTPTPEEWFWKSVAAYKLNNRELARSYLRNVLEPMKPHNPPLAERHLVVASLMLDELTERWSKDDLDNTARKMDNVKRRLDLGLAKGDTQRLQKEIIDDLDKKIKDMEDEIKKQNESSGGGQAKSMQPSGDSKIMNGAGEGEVENKKMIMSKDVWGKMPEKEKVKALEAVNRQLPPHIREAAEGFSKKLNQKSP